MHTNLTIAIPFYHGLDFLKIAVKSVLNQSQPNWRLLVVDDCGPEPGAGEWLAGLNDSRIHYFRNDRNLGIAGNWNKCFELCETEWITLLHADDALMPDYLKKMHASTLRFPDAVAIFCSAQVIGTDGKRIFSFPDFVKKFLIPSSTSTIQLRGEPAVQSLMRGNFIMCPTLCYQRSLSGNSPFQERWKMVLDLQFIITALTQGHNIIGIPEVLYSYRRHANNQTVKLSKNFVRFQEEIQIYNEIAQTCRRLRWHQAEKVAAAKRIVFLNLIYCIVSDLCAGRLSLAFARGKFLLSNLSPSHS